MRTKILFIGGGNMTKAIISGLLNSKQNAQDIYVVDRNEPKREYFAQLEMCTSINALEFLQVIDIVILAIKPQSAKEVCRLLDGKLSNKLIISVMAGITTQLLSRWLGEGLAIIRAMPNTPAMIGEGATGLFANAHTTAVQKDIATKIMTSIGITAWLTQEEQINAITALSGSGPAYYFYFVEIMQRIAINLGLPEDIATKFAIQTAHGAAKLARDSNESVEQLRARVTSKNGTTYAAIEAMDNIGLTKVLEAGLVAATNRAHEISTQMSKLCDS